MQGRKSNHRAIKGQGVIENALGFLGKLKWRFIWVEGIHGEELVAAVGDGGNVEQTDRAGLKLPAWLIEQQPPTLAEKLIGQANAIGRILIEGCVGRKDETRPVPADAAADRRLKCKGNIINSAGHNFIKGNFDLSPGRDVGRPISRGNANDLHPDLTAAPNDEGRNQPHQDQREGYTFIEETKVESRQGLLPKRHKDRVVRAHR